MRDTKEYRSRALQASWDATVSCSFEVDFCGWSTGEDGEDGWLRNTASDWTDTGPSSAIQSDWYAHVSSWAHDQDFVLTSSVFEPSEAIRHLHFHFHMHGEDMGRLRLEAFSSAGWTELWSRAGEQGQMWQLAVARLPPNVTALRFVGTTYDGGWWSDMALDAIGTGPPSVEFAQLACEFLLDACLWQSTGASSWQLAGDADGHWLEASGNSSHASDWVLETAALFNTTEEKALVFDYQLSGSDTVALEVQHQTSADGWQRLLLESGGRGAVWHTATVAVPVGSVGFRFVANVTGEADVVRIDSLHFPRVFTEVACDFEVDFCGWSTGEHPWLRNTASDWRKTGPALAAQGGWYAYVESWAEDQDFVLTSSVFEPSEAIRHLHFHFHMHGEDMGRLRLEAFSSAGWTELWSRAGEQGQMWQLAVARLPPNVTALRFVGTTYDGGWWSDMALDAIGTGPPSVEFAQLACEFLLDACLWQSTGASSWQLAGDADGHWLEASGNSSHASDWVLETAALFNTTEEKALVFDYQLSGSDTVALEVQHQTSADGWQRLLLESGGRGAVWHTATVAVPVGSVGFRFVANVTGEADVVRIDSLHFPRVFTEVACDFEVDFCGWSTGEHPWLRNTASDWRKTGPALAAQGGWYAYVESWAEDQDFVLTSSVFEPSEAIRHLHFHFHMRGEDMGRLRLEAFSSAGWTQLWSRTGDKGPQWQLALVVLPPNITALRFVGTTYDGGWWGDMAVDAIGTGLPTVEFSQLTCDFSFDTCLWRSNGASSWQLEGDGSGQWLEASGNTSHASEFILETAALFNTTEEKALVFDYQLSGSNTVTLEVQHQTSAFGWQRLLLQSGGRSAVWNGAVVIIPGFTVGLRFVANVTGDLATVKLDSLLAIESAGALAEVGCTFEQDMCNWRGDWGRRSGPSPNQPVTGPQAAFHAESYVYAGTVRGQVFRLTSPLFPKPRNVSYLEFAYHMLGGGVGKLELWYLKGGRWSSRWSRQGNQGADWLQAKVRLPSGVEMLRFVSSGALSGDSEVALDGILAWEGPEAAPAEFLSLSSGGYHNCAVLKAEGLLKCWGSGRNGRLGYGGEANVGTAPGEMGENLPAVDLGEPGVRVTKVSCGQWHTCAVLETGVLKCFGSGSYGKLGYGHTRHVGDEPLEMGQHLPAVDLGTGVEVVHVAAGIDHTCALLRGGRVKCFGQGRLLGLGDEENRGDEHGEMGSELPVVDLGTDFEAVQLALGYAHSCALSSQSAVKCWGQSNRLGLGLGDGGRYIGTNPNEMGDALPVVDLGPLPAVQIAAGAFHTCAVLSDGSVKCWGDNGRGQLGHGNLQDAGDQPSEMGTSLPITDMGDGVTVVRIADSSGSYHTCAVLQDANLKCWGRGWSGQLGQGNLEDLGDEPSEMGSRLRAVGLGNREVRDVGTGVGHTCVLLNDDTTRCWGAGSAGQLGIGSSLSVGQVPGELGVALVPAELFRLTLGAGLQGLSLLAVAEDHGFATGLLQLQHGASVGLVCDDGFDDRVAQVACRDLGLAGGRALAALAMWGAAGAGTILADNIRCTGAEVSLRDCIFRGWHVHDCAPEEVAGIQCASDAWSDFTPAASPAGRQDASLVWDSETQSAWMFGGHASNAFLYFADLWRYDWPRRAWTEILPLSGGAAPGARWGHAAVWDAHSRSMLVFGGRFQVTFYDDVWQFRSEDSAWRQLPALAKSSARAYHTAILDPVERAVLVFGGESGSQVLEDLQRYSLADGQWSKSGATGPGARSRHTAVWVPTTRSMLVFGGWTGQQYLDGLCSYDASAGTWAELSAAGSWPTARAGHAAAWDPVSMSMLVMGGITNVSNDLSYDASIYNYTLLTNSWKEEGLQSQVVGPSGRTGHGVVWDFASRGLLSFGGFNASYLQQTWRYVVSQTNPPLLVHCQQGRNCSFRRNASGSVAAKRNCSDPDFLAGLPTLLSEAEEEGLWMFAGNASPFFTEPGHHRLCWCDVNCSHPDNFSVTVAYFIVEGPQLRQSARCYLGTDCTIAGWRGVGISVNDSLVMRGRCNGEPEASSSTYPRRSVGVSFNESYGWHTLHVGFLDPSEGLKPEALELCWCPAAAAPCASAEDFLVVALSLEVLCPPGEYSEGPGSSCLPCPPNFFCPGGSEVQSCPSASTSAVGSSQLPDCLCLRGRYWDAESTICLACPAGSSTLQEGATGLGSCTCMPGFFNTQPDNPAVCEACGVGFFCTGGLQARQPCAASQTTESDTSADESQCVCRAGSFLEDGLCTPCPVGFFKGSVGDFPCSPCGSGSFSNGTGNTERCRCLPGYGLDEEINKCTECAPGEYKALVGDTPCSRCSANKTSVQAATSPLDCRCRSGLAAEGDACRVCRAGFFCPGQGEEIRCPENATSRVGSLQQADCLCNPGYYALEARAICEPCQPGRYKPTLANDPSCPLQCPTNGESANASTDLRDCFCVAGFYAVLDEAGWLARCASCAFLPHLQCLGGFHTQAGITQTGNHTLPVARPGHFQTGQTITVKCTAVTATGLSTCLGGQPCEQDDAVDCFGRYGNACDEGSTGFLCGECPYGWARSAFQRPCEPCATSSAMPLIAAVIIDVGTKATVSFVVASMAATAAVRASSKLHTVMIRIATQWLAVCSVLATFDLTQIPINEDTETWSREEDARLFPWPAQVTAAMLGLFETLTLTPVLTSIDSAAQCLAQEFSSQSTAPSLAVGVYYLILPLLVILGIVLLSLLVVHGLVPSGQRLGFAFNEAGRRHRRKAKAMQSLREAMDQMLGEAFPKTSGLPAVAPTSNAPTVTFSWVDLERSGALHFHTVAQVQLAAEDLDAFLCHAVIGSRELLLRACAARAAQLRPQAEAQKVHEELAQVDLRPFLTTDFASQFVTFTSMLDMVLDEVQTGVAFTGAEALEDSEENDAQEHLKEGSEPSAGCEAAEGALQATDDAPHEVQIAVSKHDLSPMVDTVVDSLDFGLFSAAPRFGQLARQSIPVIWVSLVSLWPGLLSSFLQMIWCVPVPEDDVIVNRLLPNPSVICWSDEHFVSARIAIAGLVVWCVGIPLTLAVLLLRIPDRQAPENFRRFGYFFQGLEPKFWWWDLLVKRLDLASEALRDVALMMLLTYTSVVPDPKGKLMLFPALSGFQVFLASWVKPYANDQAEILDVVEAVVSILHSLCGVGAWPQVTLSMIRFLLFFAVASLLILKPPAATTHAPLC
ncbi:unnamed protein product [Symbiodinium sp. CCMP2592]|nr:unnamed protein product [Symbiodinium sp. CCMP2592]